MSSDQVTAEQATDKFIDKARAWFYPEVDMLDDIGMKKHSLRITEENHIIRAILRDKDSDDRINTYRELFPKDQENPVISAVAFYEDDTCIEYVPQKLKDNKKFAEFILEFCGDALAYFSDGIQSDLNLCTVAIKQSHGRAIQHASKEFKENKEIAIMAVNLDGNNYHHLAETIKNDPDIALLAIQENGNAHIYLNQNFKADREFAKQAVMTTPSALGVLTDTFKDDYEIVRLTIPKKLSLLTTFNLKHASPRIQRDPNVLIDFFKMAPIATELFVQDNFRNEFDVIHGFMEALDKESPVDLYKILKALDVADTNPVRNPYFDSLVEKRNMSCIDLLVTRVSENQLNPVLFNLPYLKEKVEEEKHRRKLLELEQTSNKNDKPTKTKRKQIQP